MRERERERERERKGEREKGRERERERERVSERERARDRYSERRYERHINNKTLQNEKKKKNYMYGTYQQTLFLEFLLFLTILVQRLSR